MSVAYDATSAGTSGVNTSGSTASGTSISITAASGADVFFALQIAAGAVAGAPSSVQFNGSAMTLVDSQSADNLGDSAGTYLYRAAGAGTGGAKSITYSIPNNTWYVAGAVSATGVGTVGTAVKAFGVGTAVSSGSITLTTGQLAICAYGSGFGAAHTMSSATGGTNRYLATTAGTAGEANLAISTATATATFGATNASSLQWSSVAVVLSAAGNSYSSGANTTATFTPSVSGVRGARGGANTTAVCTPAVNWGSLANRSATFSTTVAGSKGAHGGANTTVAFASPPSGAKGLHGGANAVSVFGSVVGDAFAGVLTKLGSGRSATIQTIGDSTAYGVGDGNIAVTGAIGGWQSRLGIIIGAALNVNVTAQTYSGPYWGSGTGTWGSATTLYTSSLGGAAPTLLLLNGGAPGTTLVLDESEASTYNLFSFFGTASSPDVFILADGFNDLIVSGISASTYTSRYEALISAVQADCPGVPIIVTTQNVTTVNTSTVLSGVNALTNGLVGQSTPLSPPYQPSTFAGNVWVLDTRQAYASEPIANLLFTGVFNGSSTSGLHPNPDGYSLQANWMVKQLAPGLPAYVSDGANTTVTVSRSSGGVVSGGANRAVAFSTAASGVRGARATANAGVSVTAASGGSLGAKGGADRLVTFNFIVSQGGNHFTDGANRSAVFGRSGSGVRAVLDGANTSSVFGRSVVGRRGAHDTANTGVVWHTAQASHLAGHGTANAAVGWSTGLSNDSELLTSGSWPGTSGTVTFTPQPLTAGDVVTAEISGGGLSVTLPVIEGFYLVQFSPLLTVDGAVVVDPFAFACPSGGSVDLNSIVGPTPVTHRWGVRG